MKFNYLIGTVLGALFVTSISVATTDKVDTNELVLVDETVTMTLATGQTGHERGQGRGIGNGHGRGIGNGRANSVARINTQTSVQSNGVSSL